MPRINAEEIDFEAYFADCQAHEPVSQRWKPFHRLPPQSGSGCYMLLADFGAATRNKQPPYSGMYAFYFGRSDVAFTEKGEKSEGLKSRGDSYFHKKDRAPNILRKALMDEGGIPTILMCSQIPVSEGKGVLEAVMLHRYDFFTNGTYNGGVRPMKEGEASLVDSFRQACMKVKIQKPIEHRKFFASIQKDLTDASLRNAVLMNSRRVSVKVQEAYAAVAAAEASPNLSTNSRELLGQQRRRLQGRLCIMLEQLKEAEAEVENVAAMLQGNIDQCYHYYNDYPPITQPRGKAGRPSPGTYAYRAALAAEKAQEAAWAAAKSDQPTPTPSAASQATAAKLALLGIAVATPLPTAHPKKGGAAAQAPSSSMRQTRRMTAAQQQRTSSPVPEVPCTLFEGLCDELQVQKLQRRNFRLNIETAQGKGDISVLEKSLLNLRLLDLPKARHIVQDQVKGTPYHPQTNQLCAKKEHFLHIIALLLMTEALPESEGDEEAHPPKASAVQLSILEDLSTTSSFRVSESVTSSKDEPHGEEEENDA